MRPYLRPLSFLYAQVVAVKNSLYNRGWFYQYKAPTKVISIGNLTMGGTGKTPLTDFCVKDLTGQGYAVAVVSRSYRASAKEPLQVHLQTARASQIYGDEPVQLARANPEADFYVGPSKWQTAQMAASQKSYDVMIVDDGFQHRTLVRDLDIVILDATEALENYEMIPEGRAREGWDSLGRSSLIVVTKCNWASPQQLLSLKEKLPQAKDVVFADYEVLSVRWVHKDQELPILQMQDQKVFLVSAIGNPEVFESQMSQVMKVTGSLHYRDHHPYTHEDIQEILEQFRKSGARYLLTTDKDAVKLQDFIPSEIPLITAPITVQERGSEGKLHEVLSRLLQ